jgi:hypothetical protein
MGIRPLARCDLVGGMVDEGKVFKQSPLLYRAHKLARPERRALPAGGRDETTPLYRNQPQATEMSENAATPTSRVHAMLGVTLRSYGINLAMPRLPSFKTA